MSVRASIRGVYRDLKPIQRRIADYLLSVDFEGLDAPIHVYARRTGASIASISRFCARIGYDSFQKLKIGLSREVQAPEDTVLPIFAADDDPQLSIRKVFAEAAANLQATEAAVSFPAIVSVAERIARSERLYFLGLGGSGGVGLLGEVMFCGLGFNAKALSDPYAMLLCAGHARKSHLVLGLSHSGRTREVLQAVRTAKARGAYTVGITNYPHSPLAELVQTALLTSCHEHRVHFAQSNSMAAQLTLIRALYILVASRISPEALQEVNRIEQAVGQSLRLKTLKVPKPLMKE
jgi:RpiR family carbohydrate utilization transcriptional regulator